MPRIDRRMSRLIEMLRLLAQGEGWNAPALARHFGVSRAQIYHDIRALRTASVPIRVCRDGYRIGSAGLNGWVQLSPRDVVALLTPLGLFAGTSAEGQAQRAARQKLLACLPAEQRAGARQLLDHCAVSPPPDIADPALALRLRDAAVERRQIQVACRAQGDEPSRLVVLRPYGLACRGGRWVVVGHCPGREGECALPLSAIATVRPTPYRFRPPADASVHETVPACAAAPAL